MSDNARIDEIEARVKAATVGPWEPKMWCNTGFGGFAAIGPWHKHMPEDYDGDDPDDCNGKRARLDAEFIAHARTDVPWLIQTIRDLEAELTAAREAHAADREKARRALMPFASLPTPPGNVSYHVVLDSECNHACDFTGFDILKAAAEYDRLGGQNG